MSIQSEINRLKQAVSDAFTAIGNKGGTVPSSKVSGNLATAINSIPSGVTVQTKTGTFTTSKGSATINCGFKPDVLFITQNAKYVDYINSACFAFTAAGSDNICAGTWNSEGNYIEFYGDRTNTGASIDVFEYDDSWDTNYYDSNFSYAAIKYT